MSIYLPVGLRKFVCAKVDSGRYDSASEVVREALRLLEEQDRALAAQLAGSNEKLGRRLGHSQNAQAETRSKVERKFKQQGKAKA
jgi:antitoxin ParD1/3/4